MSPSAALIVAFLVNLNPLGPAPIVNLMVIKLTFSVKDGKFWRHYKIIDNKSNKYHFLDEAATYTIKIVLKNY